MSRVRTREDEKHAAGATGGWPARANKRFRGNPNVIRFALSSTGASHLPADVVRFASSAAEGPVTL